MPQTQTPAFSATHPTRAQASQAPDPMHAGTDHRTRARRHVPHAERNAGANRRRTPHPAPHPTPRQRKPATIDRGQLADRAQQSAVRQRTESNASNNNDDARDLRNNARPPQPTAASIGFFSLKSVDDRALSRLISPNFFSTPRLGDPKKGGR